jgi:hypothetical protein
LSLLEHLPELDADQRALSCRKRFAPQHGTSDPFDAAVGLRYDILQIWRLTDDDRRAVCLIVPPDSSGIGLAPIDGNRLRNAMATKRLGEEARGRPLVAQQGFTLLTSVAEVHDQCKLPSEYSWFVKDSHHRLCPDFSVSTPRGPSRRVCAWMGMKALEIT